MNDDAARPREFGTGLRFRIERGAGLDARRAGRSSRDLVLLCAEKPAERAARAPRLGGRDLAVRGQWGSFAV